MYFIDHICKAYGHGVSPDDVKKHLLPDTTTYEIYYRDAKHEKFITEIDVTEEWPDAYSMEFDKAFAHIPCWDFDKMIEKLKYNALNAKYEAFKDKLDELPELPDLTEEELEDTEIADYPCYILHYDGADYAFYDKIRGFTEV